MPIPDELSKLFSNSHPLKVMTTSQLAKDARDLKKSRRRWTELHDMFTNALYSSESRQGSRDSLDTCKSIGAKMGHEALKSAILAEQLAYGRVTMRKPTTPPRMLGRPFQRTDSDALSAGVSKAPSPGTLQATRASGPALLLALGISSPSKVGSGD